MDKTPFPLINDIFLCAMIGGPIKRYGKQNKYDIDETVPKSNRTIVVPGTKLTHCPFLTW
jgi:hypothetical protein